MLRFPSAPLRQVRSPRRAEVPEAMGLARQGNCMYTYRDFRFRSRSRRCRYPESGGYTLCWAQRRVAAWSGDISPCWSAVGGSARRVETSEQGSERGGPGELGSEDEWAQANPRKTRAIDQGELVVGEAPLGTYDENDG